MTAYITFLMVVSASIWSITKYISETINKNVEQNIKTKVHTLRNGSFAISLTHILNGLFNLIYGPKQLTIRCFVASLLLSTIYVSVLVFLTEVFIIGLEKYVLYVFSNPFFLFEQFSQTALPTITFVLVVNGIGDFVSVWVSRTILKISTRVESMRQILFLHFSDLIVSGVLFILIAGLCLLTAFGTGIMGSESTFLYPEEIAMSSEQTQISQRIAYVIIFSSAYLSSMLLLMFMISIVLLKLNERNKSLFYYLDKVLDFEDRPVQSLGLYTILMVWGIGLLFSPIVIFFV
ncbi:hypothetical protein [Vibrio parahaemolyticus]|uniref:hypothetical protein n=1 Tax=Vibrio parahaemolyticus TaxID=670 RepID=UPI001F4F42B6|nr:hypothetical protein [Vibrio parahaemolyticus]HCM0862624.1 hypothetical protein [Vibrio parahaemolyticus]